MQKVKKRKLAHSIRRWPKLFGWLWNHRRWTWLEIQAIHSRTWMGDEGDGGFRRQPQVVLFNLTIERAGYCAFNARRPALLKIGSFSPIKTKEKERSTAVLTTAPFPQRPPFSLSLSASLSLPPSIERAIDSIEGEFPYDVSALISWKPTQKTILNVYLILLAAGRSLTFLRAFFLFFLYLSFFSGTRFFFFYTFSLRFFFFLLLSLRAFYSVSSL